jgi:hypothetical protein
MLCSHPLFDLRKTQSAFGGVSRISHTPSATRRLSL